MSESGIEILDCHPDRGLLPPGIGATLRRFNLEQTQAVFALELARIPPGLDAATRKDVVLLVLALLACLGQGHTRLALAPGTDSAAAALLAACNRAELDLGALARDPRIQAIVGADQACRPLIIEGDQLYSHRLRAAEQRFAATVTELLAQPLDLPAPVPAEIFTDPVPLDEQQRRAVQLALTRPLALVTGGPGTGKTSILLAILRALLSQGLTLDQVALAAPTGKAAQRMGEAMRRDLNRIKARGAIEAAIAGRLKEPETLHRLLGWLPADERFRYDSASPLPARVVVVDEASMVGQELMDRLFQALAPGARIILLGDARQLPSVESGSAFRDLVATQPGCTQWLQENYRMRGGDTAGARVLEVANALQAPATLVEPGGIRVLADLAEWKGQGVERLDPGAAGPRAFLERWFREIVLDQADFPALASRDYPLGPDGFEAADSARIRTLFDHFKAFRILCALRAAGDLRGVESINKLLHGWMYAHTGQGLRRETPFYAGEPILMLRNDYRRRIFNGDQGLVLRVRFGDGVRQAAVFPSGTGYKAFPLDPLHGLLELSYAMTVHKAQGSEYQRVAIILPGRNHPALTRELLYTAITRASQAVTLIGEGEAVLWAAGNLTERSTGLQERLT